MILFTPIESKRVKVFLFDLDCFGARLSCYFQDIGIINVSRVNMDRTGLLKDDSASPSRSSTCSDTDRLLQEEYGEKLPAKSSHSRSLKTAILHVVSWIIHATLLFTILAVLNSKLQCDEDRTYSKCIELSKRIRLIDYLY